MLSVSQALDKNLLKFSIKYILHCVSKNDTDIAYYNYNAHQLILITFGRNAAERVSNGDVVSHLS